MILVIAVMIAITIAVAAYKLAPRLGDGRIVFAVEPDTPAAFGYDMAWLAVRTRDTESVVSALLLQDPQRCNWNSGIGTIYDAELGEDHVYVSPPVNGWTFVVGLPLPHPSSSAFVDKCTPLLVALGGRFVEVQYFFSYPPIDMFAWARMVDGRLLRAFAAGDEGVIWNKGKTSREERALRLEAVRIARCEGSAWRCGRGNDPASDGGPRHAPGHALEPRSHEAQCDVGQRRAGLYCAGAGHVAA